MVEDNENDVLLVQMEFAHAPGNIQLRAVTDGQEAIHYILREGPYADPIKCPPPDVILLDLKMPRLDGFDFLKWLRNEAPFPCRLIPVVVMSSSNEKRDVDRAYELGANTFFCKPVDWIEFKAQIRALGIYWAEHAETPHA